jgi:hypothetical protein
MRTEGELRALLVLLGDDDENVVAIARGALLEARAAAMPYLTAAVDSPDPRLRGRVRLLLEDLRLAVLEERWQAYIARPDDDLVLEEGCLLLSGVQRPVDERAFSAFLDAVSGMVRSAMVHVHPLQALGEVIFENMGFRGGDYAEPDNYYVAPALERRVGIPIVLASIYVLIGRRIGLPVTGVAAPSHYLARMETDTGPVFIDCYNRGRTYQEATLAAWLRGRGVPNPQRFLTPCTHRFTLYRMLNNCEKVHTDAGDDRLAGTVRRWRELLQVPQ